VTDGSAGPLAVAFRWLRARLRAVGRIARWEVRRSVGVVDRRTAALGLAAGSAALDTGVYRIGVAADSPYHDVVTETPALAAREPDRDAIARGDAEVVIQDGRFYVGDSPKASAALSTLRDAVRQSNLERMRAEDNESAAFPVVVTLRYAERGGGTADGGRDGDGSSGGGLGGGGSNGDGSGGSGADADSTGGVDGGGASGGPTGGTSGDGPLGVPSLGAGFFGGGTSGSPADISPPFPFASLVLAFAFFIPMNFVIQPYGSTILNERINRRGELLLVAPVSPGDIVAGKTLPYFGVLLGTVAVISLAIGGGPASVAAVAPIAALFLAATFAGAMFARSFKELTFVTVTVSVFLTTYAFVPAIFTNVTPIALISPLTLVVRDLQGTGVTLGQYVFSTGPFYLSTAVLFLLGLGVYREEDMFTQRPVPLKFLDAINSRVVGRRSAATWSALWMPFVFIAELLAVAVLFVLPVDISIPLLLVVVAAVEEVAKSVHVFAAFRGPFADSRTARTALVLGALSGLGFFLAEKATAVVQLVGLPDLAVGQAAFGPVGLGVPGAAALLVAPLVLHCVTAAASALGAARSRGAYLGTLVVAVGVHAAYNLAVVSALA
jgi:ABC-type Na+ efflux pump permease subunit